MWPSHEKDPVQNTEEASDASYEALGNLLETTPTTPAGAKALLEWLALNLDRGDEWPIFRSREVFELLKSRLRNSGEAGLHALLDAA